jgi:hypothetical protein
METGSLVLMLRLNSVRAPLPSPDPPVVRPPQRPHRLRLLRLLRHGYLRYLHRRRSVAHGAPQAGDKLFQLDACCATARLAPPPRARPSAARRPRPTPHRSCHAPPSLPNTTKHADMIVWLFWSAAARRRFGSVEAAGSPPRSQPPAIQTIQSGVRPPHSKRAKEPCPGT